MDSNKRFFALAITFIIVISGCQSSNYTPQSDANSTPIDLTFQNVSYAYIRDLLPSQAPTDTAVETLPLAQRGVVAGANDLLNIGALFIPDLGPISAFTDWIGAGVNGAKVAQQINELADSILALEGQVQNLQTELNWLNSDFMTLAVEQNKFQAKVATDLFSDRVSTIVNNTTGGVFNSMLLSMEGNWQSPPDYPEIVSLIGNINGEALYGRSQPYLESVNYLSTVQLPLSANATTPLYQQLVNVNNSSQTVSGLFSSMREFMYSQFPEFPGEANASIVPLIEQYNNQVTYVYQIGIAALQAAFASSAMINQVNYYQALYIQDGNLSAQLPPLVNLEMVKGSYYRYDKKLDASGNANAYLEAQLQLALLYAARMNSLFKTAVSNIISDQPLGDFVYPSMESNIIELNTTYADMNYSKYFALTIPTSKMQNDDTNNQSFPTINAQGGYIFYMYKGLNQFAACQSSFLNAQEVNASSCESVYDKYAPLNTPGIYDGQNLQVWTLSPYAQESNLTFETNLSRRCDVSMMSDQRWVVDIAYVQYNQTSGFSCTANQSADADSGQNFVFNGNPQYLIGGGSGDFYWYRTCEYDSSKTSYCPANINFTFATDPGSGIYTLQTETSTSPYDWNQVTVNGGQMSSDSYKSVVGVEALYDVEDTTAAEYSYKQSYQGALVINAVTNFESHQFYAQFTVSCPTYDPICTVHTQNNRPGICLGGRFVEMNATTEYAGDNETYFTDDDAYMRASYDNDGC